MCHFSKIFVKIAQNISCFFYTVTNGCFFTKLSLYGIIIVLTKGGIS